MSEVLAERACHLPSSNNNDKITLLVRDPNYLYAYWDISDDKKQHFLQEFGKDVWEKSVPVLKVTNVSKNSSFSIRINDFSNSWYIHVDEPDSLYVVELGRLVSDRFFINLAGSNYAATPANRVSSNSATYFIDYRELKKGRFDLGVGRIYELYERGMLFNGMIGLSSPELFTSDWHESLLGTSSPELFGAGMRDNLGISSGSFSFFSGGII